MTTDLSGCPPAVYDSTYSSVRVDLSSFGYLGLRHTNEELHTWTRFTSGRPAAAEEDETNNLLAQRLAALQRCEATTLAPSTAHIFSDLCVAFANDDVEIFIDEHVYPIARWGVERAIVRGTRVVELRHQDPTHLESMLAASHAQLKRSIVVVDGISAINWSVTPLQDYLECVERYGGLLVVDDTQACGLLGHSADAVDSFGRGGGGSLSWHEIESPHVLLVTSLTKSFGVSVAVLAGSRRVVNWFASTSQSRIHCTPPSNPALCALEHALDVNDARGDELRDRLAENVRCIRQLLLTAGLATKSSFYPVQSVALPVGVEPATLDRMLRERGVCATFEKKVGGAACVLLVVTADHDQRHLEYAIDVLQNAFHEATARTGH